MNLNENSKNLLIILQKDPEKLKVFTSLKSEQEVYEYAVSLIPNYTKKEFEELKEILCNESKMECLSEEKMAQISGGSLNDIADVFDSYQQGVNISKKVFTEVFGPVKQFLAGLKKQDKK